MAFEGDRLAEADLGSLRPSPPIRRAGWFADLIFHADFSVTARTTGRRVTLADLTPQELGKFLIYFGGVLGQSAQRRLRGESGPSVFFTPQIPRPWHVIWSALALSGVRIARTAEAADAIFYFEDSTHGIAPAPSAKPLLNAAVTDISKSRVAAVFERVAGYPLSLDPRRHRGLAVEKSEANGAHDGRLVLCPREPVSGKTYQHFIDSRKGGAACDLRTTIIDRRACFVVEKTRPAHLRFAIHNMTARYRALDEVFSPAHRNLLNAFAQEMGLDWAALDVLRDRAHGRIYVVDVNKTDTGPAVDLSIADREKLKKTIADGMSAMLRDRIREFSPAPAAAFP